MRRGECSPAARFRSGGRLAYSVPDTEPASLVVGDTWHWTKRLSDYPAGGGWTLTYAFIGPATFQIVSPTLGTITAAGDAFDVVLDPDETAALTAGNYRWVAFVTDGSSNRYEADSGTCYLQPNAATLTGDQRTQTEQELSAVNALILARETGVSSGGEGAIESYQIANRAVHKLTLPELYKLRAVLETRLWREQHPGQLAPPVHVRFLRPHV